MTQRRILAILDVNPFPSTDGSTYPIEGQLRGLAEHWGIDILEVHRAAVKSRFETETHREIANHVFRVDAKTARSSRKRASDELLFGRPFFVEPTISVKEMASTFGEV